MKRKVYNPRPEYILTGRPNIDIWNQEYVINPFIDAESVYDSEEWKIMLKFEILNKKLRVLEAGCGNGKWIKALYGLVEYICGIDFAITGLKAIKEVIPEALVVQGDVRYLPYKNCSLDLILSWGVMEHFENFDDVDIVLKESHRCLNDGGILIVSVPYLSLNRLFNPQVVARRFASRINWLRKIFKKGKKQFFQYEFTISEFKKKIIKNNFKIKHYELFWLDLGLRDDFRGLYPFVKYPIEFFSRIAQFKKSVNFAFAAFMLFICQKI